MASLLPSFVLGYHGCDEAVAEAVFAGRQQLRPSANEYDWLGSGIYFWENSSVRAMEYAKLLREFPSRTKSTIHKAAVVGAVIDLGYCLNLLDSEFLELVKEAYDELHRWSMVAGVELPENRRVEPGNELLLRHLDCAVINSLHDGRETEGLPAFETVRAAFIEGEPLYPGSGFNARNHIQVCVRSPRCIKGYFRPLPGSDAPDA